MFRSLLQAKTVDRHSPKELAGWTPFLDSSVSSHQCYPWSGPTVASAGQTERGGSPAGPGARSPQTANRRAWHEPLSRDRVDSPQRQPLDDGVQWHVQEKHPERKEQAPRSAEDSLATPDSRPPDQGQHWPQKVGGLSGATRQRLRDQAHGGHLGRVQAGPPAVGAPAPLIQGSSRPPSLWVWDSRGTSSGELGGADEQSCGRTVPSWSDTTS